MVRVRVSVRVRVGVMVSVLMRTDIINGGAEKYPTLIITLPCKLHYCHLNFWSSIFFL